MSIRLDATNQEAVVHQAARIALDNDAEQIGMLARHAEEMADLESLFAYTMLCCRIAARIRREFDSLEWDLENAGANEIAAALMQARQTGDAAFAAVQREIILEGFLAEDGSLQ